MEDATVGSWSIVGCWLSDREQEDRQQENNTASTARQLADDCCLEFAHGRRQINLDASSRECAAAKPRRLRLPPLSVMQAQPLICPGHSRPIPFISYSKQTDDGVFLISACLGECVAERSSLVVELPPACLSPTARRTRFQTRSPCFAMVRLATGSAHSMATKAPCGLRA